MSLISIARLFYSKRTLTVILLLGFAANPALAQRKKPKGPRATGIVVMSEDGKTPKRLIPVCIRDNDQFWDASIYHANPVPMAIDPGIVYEVYRSGVPVGLFIVRTPTNTNGAWAANGKWQPPRANTGPLAKLPVADPDVPVLRRTKPPEDDEHPTLKAAQPAPASPDTDPDRPELKRGKPSPTPEPSPTPSASAAKKPEAPIGKAPELLAAVSDADGPDSHSYLLVDLKPEEQSKLRDTAVSLAQGAVVKQATIAGTRLEMKNPSVRYFDLDGNNSPEVVLNGIVSIMPGSASRSSKAQTQVLKDFYVTVIGKEDLSGDVHLVYSRVVSARNAEFDGRLELVDAVDVDGDGRGELLFRRLTGNDVTYLVLKLGLHQSTTLFDSSGR